MFSASLTALCVGAWVGAHTAGLAAGTTALSRLQLLRNQRGQRGQASAEYALVLLGCAAVALLITAWATKTNSVGKLLDKVMDSVSDKVKG